MAGIHQKRIQRRHPGAAVVAAPTGGAHVAWSAVVDSAPRVSPHRTHVPSVSWLSAKQRLQTHRSFIGAR